MEISRQLVWKRKLKRKRRCPQCGAPKGKRTKLCDPCRETHNRARAIARAVKRTRIEEEVRSALN